MIGERVDETGVAQLDEHIVRAIVIADLRDDVGVAFVRIARGIERSHERGRSRV